ncbi:PLP-dependent transferase [Sistotremastrum suecicum HHB10207 ss-3]|uniref:PLP-dependent transferase n=1 Tax=Sistotremastrum suecicum HHB10207 ss-3 TaxID=1314776 RepID=A0A166HS59_9AGAM|nr:PLP-dependent transferase [Sistotremastrum suecicum HHB10207 ss-3]
MATINGVPVKSPVPLSSRMQTGRAMALDVWSVYNAANLPADCINLGQGYMNFPPPQWVKDAATEALGTVAGNHYSHPKGRPRLREAIRDYYSASYGRTLNVDNEILVTSGANEGQYAMFTAFLDPGDEVIMFEPYFDQYLPSVTFNAGTPVFVPLHPPSSANRRSTSDDWTIDFEELRAAFSPKTKMIIVNTPHNPVGKVFRRDELEKIAALAKEFNTLVMADEVYDCLVYDQKEHVRIATLPGMWERTVTVGSAGKSFAATGWRVGWLVGPPTLIGPVLAATTRIVYCSNSPLQEAAAAGLEQAPSRNFFPLQLQAYQERRDILLEGFDRLGMNYTHPEGSYFALLDISNVDIPDDYPFPQTIHGRGRDFKACWFIAMEVGVSSIPVSEFYGEKNSHIGEKFARFAFCKDTAQLKEAVERLQKLKNYLK